MDIPTTAANPNLLRGAPLSCLCALLIARLDGIPRVGSKWVQQMTGYGSDAVQEGLEYLRDILHLATSTGRYEGWQLAGSALQLPLGADLTEASPGKTDSRVVVVDPDQEKLSPTGNQKQQHAGGPGK